MKTASCESCSMPTDGSQYCAHCVDDTGKLQPFDQRLERMVGWLKRQQPEAPRAQLERSALAWMATMPAWKDHPRIKAAFP